MIFYADIEHIRVEESKERWDKHLHLTMDIKMNVTSAFIGATYA